MTYSGTVAGALEATLLHVPGLAFSAAVDERGQVDYEGPSEMIRSLARQVLSRGLPAGVLLNVNFPARSPQGVRITRQGTRTYRATAVERRDPTGRPYYWIDDADATPTGEPDGDHIAIRDGFVSVTPLHSNMTHGPTREMLADWQIEEAPTW